MKYHQYGTLAFISAFLLVIISNEANLSRIISLIILLIAFLFMFFSLIFQMESYSDEYKYEESAKYTRRARFLGCVGYGLIALAFFNVAYDWSMSYLRL